MSERSARSFAFVLTRSLLPWVAILCGGLAACAQSEKRSPPPDNLIDSGLSGDGSTDTLPPPIEGLTALTIEPKDTALTLAYASPIVPVKASLKAKGTFKDGSTKDVTNSVAWSTGMPTEAPISVTNGELQSSVPGKLVVTAQAGSIAATANVVIKLTGDVIGSGAPPDAPTKLGGTPSGTSDIAYPLDGALFPYKLGPIELHIKRGDASQTLSRVEITGDAIDLRIYGTCDALSSGCGITLDDALWPLLAGASEGDAIKTRVRLVAPSGGSPSESAQIEVRWTFNPLSGGLYYWRAYDHDKSSAVFRFNLDTPGKPPEKFFVSDPDSPPLPSGDPHPCVGCHAISADGKKMGLTFGGSIPSSFALLDIAKKEFIAKKNTDPAGYATVTSFAPDGARLVNGFRGKLLLRAADATMVDIGSPLFSGLGESLALPYWSGDGKTMVFVGWRPGENGASSSNTGDLVRGGQIWIVDSDGTDFKGAPRLLVPRVPNRTQTYPATSHDSRWVVFNETRCDGPPTPGPYGNDPCDGYDDPSAHLRLVLAAGGTPVDLVRASGTDTWASSWPRFSPSRGRFRGKSLYWVAFSSRRAYGLKLSGSTNGSTKPQLWFAGLLLDDAAAASGDPSFAPVWLPNQNDAEPTGNHVPQWVTVAVPIIK